MVCEGHRGYAAVVGLTLAALLDARPNRPFWGRAWLEQVFARHLPGFDPSRSEDELCGWSVGAALDNETLVQSRPVLRDRDIDPVGDLLRTAAGCVVAAFATRPPGSLVAHTAALVRVARYRRWMGVRDGGDLTAEQRSAVRAELPDFLARAAGQSDAELVFLRYLAALHELGALGKAYAPHDAIRAALRAVAERFPNGRANLFVSDGRTLGILHRGGTLLAFEPPNEMRPSRSWRVDAGDSGAPASLLLWKDGAPPDAPDGAERIAEGVLTVPAARPSLLERD
jgi:hypothetical protein